jgi:hypothetical protein
MTKRLILPFSILLFIGCTSDKKQESNHSDSNTTVNKLPINVDQHFETFIKYFSSDSLFQVSRIDFPLKGKELDEEDEKEIIINKSAFRKLDFNKDFKNSNGTDRYELKMKVNGNKATVETRGIDNGIYIDTYFEKKDGKWKLVSWVNSST